MNGVNYRIRSGSLDGDLLSHNSAPLDAPLFMGVDLGFVPSVDDTIRVQGRLRRVLERIIEYPDNGGMVNVTLIVPTLNSDTPLLDIGE